MDTGKSQGSNIWVYLNCGAQCKGPSAPKYAAIWAQFTEADTQAMTYPFHTSEEMIIFAANHSFTLFKRKSVISIAIFLPISMISVGLITIVVPIYSKTVLNLDLIRIGYIMGISPITYIIGSILGGIITDK